MHSVSALAAQPVTIYSETMSSLRLQFLFSLLKAFQWAFAAPIQQVQKILFYFTKVNVMLQCWQVLKPLSLGLSRLTIGREPDCTPLQILYMNANLRLETDSSELCLLWRPLWCYSDLSLFLGLGRVRLLVFQRHSHLHRCQPILPWYTNPDVTFCKCMSSNKSSKSSSLCSWYSYSTGPVRMQSGLLCRKQTLKILIHPSKC